MTRQDGASREISPESRQTDVRLASLMRAAQDGDRTAYERLLEEVTALVRRAVRGHSPFLQADDVEDRVQDVLLSLHAVRATYDPARPIIPWLMAILRNRMADEARRYGRRSAREVMVDEVPETFSGEDANTHADALVESMTLRDAIEELPPAQKRAIEMVKLRELSLAEASAESGMTVAALKITVHRAVKRLRRLMGHEA